MRRSIERAQEIEANGGLLVSDGSRRKTAGGVYLFVAYTQGKPQPGKDLKKWLARARSMHADSAQNRPRSEILPPLCWDKRITVIEAIGKEIGSIETVKVMVIGRVSKYQNFGDYVVGVIEQNSEKRPSLPKGLPVPPVLKTKYLVTIGAKQWRKVASTLTDPQDALIIDGFPHLDTKTGAIAVVANSVTSKKQMAAKREQQKAKSAAAIQADPQG